MTGDLITRCGDDLVSRCEREAALCDYSHKDAAATLEEAAKEIMRLNDELDEVTSERDRALGK